MRLSKEKARQVRPGGHGLCGQGYESDLEERKLRALENNDRSFVSFPGLLGCRIVRIYANRKDEGRVH